MKGIIFDLDNTLTDRRQTITAFARRFARDFQFQLRPIPFHELESHLQNGDQLGYKPKQEMFKEMERVLPWYVPLAAGHISDYWYSVSPSCTVIRDGVEIVIASLKDRRYRLGIVTNGEAPTQNATIDALGVRDLFDSIIISETVGFRKPQRSIFELALKELELDAAITMYVGDHPHSDMLGAHNAGMRGVWLRSGGHPWDEEVPEPFAEIDRLSDVLELLDD